MKQQTLLPLEANKQKVFKKAFQYEFYPNEEQIRQHVFYLSACQFNRQEMTSGYAYKLVEELQGDQTHNEYKILYT